MKLDKRFVHKFFETAPCIFFFKLFRNEKNMHGKKERKKERKKKKEKGGLVRPYQKLNLK